MSLIWIWPRSEYACVGVWHLLFTSWAVLYVVVSLYGISVLLFWWRISFLSIEIKFVSEFFLLFWHSLLNRVYRQFVIKCTGFSHCLNCLLLIFVSDSCQFCFTQLRLINLIATFNRHLTNGTMSFTLFCLNRCHENNVSFYHVLWGKLITFSVYPLKR